ncbi:MAG: c-type cytochrome domain-containing protein, partial [Planctomycetaceae bacterium]
MLISRHSILLTVVTLLTLLQSMSLPAADFAHEVLPILKVRCGRCHTGGKKEGGLSMNTRAELLAGGENGPVVISGNAAGSRLIKLLSSDDQDVRMPPEGLRVPAGKISILKKWIDSGLPWEAGV